jgi:hypothetical protein
MTQFKFNDLFDINQDGTFSNKVKLRIGGSEIHNITIGEMELPQFKTKLSDTINSIFHVDIDSNDFYNIKNRT